MSFSMFCSESQLLDILYFFCILNYLWTTINRSLCLSSFRLQSPCWIYLTSFCVVAQSPPAVCVYSRIFKFKSLRFHHSEALKCCMCFLMWSSLRQSNHNSEYSRGKYNTGIVFKFNSIVLRVSKQDETARNLRQWSNNWGRSLVIFMGKCSMLMMIFSVLVSRIYLTLKCCANHNLCSSSTV